MPYVGAGVLASAVGMDKVTMKTVFRAHGLPIVEHVVVHAPRVARAARRGGRADRRAPRLPVLRQALEPRLERRHQQGEGGRRAAPPRSTQAARHDRKLIVERGVRAREIEVSVLGNDAPEASLPGEIVYEGEWYDYATKYAEGQTRLVCPAPVAPALTARFRELAVAAFRAIDCAGMARVDFFLDDDRRDPRERDQHDPGLHRRRAATPGCGRPPASPTPTSSQRLVDLALERHRDQSR